MAESSINNPLAFFEDFSKELLLSRYSYTMAAEETHSFEIISEIPDENKILDGATHRDYIRREFERWFEINVSNTLKDEIKKSLNLTDEALLAKDSIDSQKTLVCTLFSKIASIINKIPSEYVSLCQPSLVDYIRKVELQYPHLISRENYTYSKYLTSRSVNAGYSLNMEDSKFKQLNKLLSLLKDEGFVEQSLSLELFKKAFDNTPITKPLNIKWIKTDRKQTYLGAITELMQQLLDKKYIKDFEDTQLSKIFVRVDDTIINVNSWKSARNNTKPGKSGKRNKILDDIDYVMKNF